MEFYKSKSYQGVKKNTIAKSLWKVKDMKNVADMQEQGCWYNWKEALHILLYLTRET